MLQRRLVGVIEFAGFLIEVINERISAGAVSPLAGFAIQCFSDRAQFGAVWWRV